MKKGTKTLLSFVGLGLLAVTLTSCTASFCSVPDRSRILYTYDVYKKYVKVGEGENEKKVETGRYTYGISTYWAEGDEYKPADAKVLSFEENGVTHTYDNIYVTYSVEDNLNLRDMNAAAKNDKQTGFRVDDFTKFWARMDQKFLELSINTLYSSSKDTKPYVGDATLETVRSTITVDQLRKVLIGIDTPDAKLPGYGFVKYNGLDSEEKDNYWVNWNKAYNEVRLEIGSDFCPNHEYVTYYQNRMYQTVAQLNSCIATVDGYYGYYGYDNDNKTPVFVEAKDWGYAWNKGFLEGLLIYPLGWLIDSITIGLAGAGEGVAQLLSIFLVTFLIRALMMAFSIKQTIANAKMSELQPELARIQAKYPNANTNPSERNALASDTQALYKKYKINPFGSIITMIIQFPIFICVWGAMTGSSLLASGSFLGLKFSESVSSVLFDVNGWPGNPGWWTALVLFLIMAGLQITSMLLPQHINKKKQKLAVKQTGKNSNIQHQNNQMKWFTIIMMVMIIFMGFSLASGMVVYWIAGSIWAIIQTLVIEYINKRKKDGPKTPKKKKVKPASGAAIIDAEVSDIPTNFVAPTGKKKYKDRDKK